MILAFLGYNEGPGKWLLVTDHLPTQIINWAIGIFLTLVILDQVIRPAVRKVRTAWREHRAAQVRIEASNAVIADRLNTGTPGGLSDVIDELRRMQ